ncbi:MAG: phosphoribosylamine--glycine ligase [Chloroflexi bacterium]|nr:phosphoribosylamine--glycine ligase [Chloroflexota bacterium]
MNVLLLGSGGREHAIAWKLAQSPRLTQIYAVPGNPGTARLGRNLDGDILDRRRVASLAKKHGIDLVVIGPEAPLAAGLADDLRAAGVSVFGPSRAGAQLEASKAFAKEFMRVSKIPTACYAIFEEFEAARAHLAQASYPSVIKASGLAAGKGVFLSEDSVQAERILQDLLVENRLGAAGAQIVIEERLNGPELSVLAFTDGQRLAIMPPARDHKRLLDGDQGPNTGGMGALAPSPDATPELMQEILETILAPTLAGLNERGIDYRGVLYAGLILTEDGPKVLEYNCRFGDPEAQAILPLMESDLLEVMLGAAQGNLPDVRWRDGYAVCVVLASGGYPDTYQSGFPVSGLEEDAGALVFHAGTRVVDGRIVTHGGRVLGVTAVGGDLFEAAHRAYRAAAAVRFEDMHYRTDIGTEFSAYRAAGVDIDAGTQAVRLMKTSVEATHGPEVLAGVGAFGGLYAAAALQRMAAPVLVASTDGVGTKVSLAAQFGMVAGIGCDIVNHCINDILAQGARPLFFLDYIAVARLDPNQVAEIVAGMGVACREAGCALLGGETAEMPGVYREGYFDVAGTLVGVVERERILPRDDIRVGDVLIGLPSSGLHTNGFSLARKAFDGVDQQHVYPELGQPLGSVLLAPHRSYLPLVWPSLERSPEWIKGLAHITGGGFPDNLPRILPDGLTARVDLGAWEVPPIFRLIQRLGCVAETEMYRVFNMGIGMVAVVAQEHVTRLLGDLGEGIAIGEVVPGKEVRLET